MPKWRHSLNLSLTAERGTGSFSAHWTPNTETSVEDYSFGVSLPEAEYASPPIPVDGDGNFDFSVAYTGVASASKVVIDALQCTGTPATRDAEGKRYLAIPIKPPLSPTASPEEIAAALADAPRVKIDITPYGMPSGVATVVIPGGCKAYLDDGAELTDTSVDSANPTGQLTPLLSGPMTLSFLAPVGSAAGGFVVTFRGQAESVYLFPAEMMVDANRDGAMAFDAASVHDEDQTSAQRQYRFWINNDHDIDEGDTIGTPDSQNNLIDSKRDLEDFTRLWITFKGITEMLKTGAVTLELEWKPMDGGTIGSQVDGIPGIRVFRAFETNGGRAYLKNEGTAYNQIQSPYNTAYCEARADSPVTLTLSQVALTNLTESNPIVHLLFEGTSTGKGKLILNLKKGDQKIAEYPPLYLDLKDVRRMYERGKIALDASAIPNPWTSTNPLTPLTWVWDPWNWPPEIDPDAEAKTIAFVHGWRMPYGEYIQWADTTFKRLWQFGYTGRFYSFRWPTFSSENDGIPDIADPSLYVGAPGGLTYNPSEYRAWRSGPALSSFVNGLPNSNTRYLIAHSMGNVVAGSALLSNMQVKRYAMCNSAMAGMAYNGSIQDRNYLTPDIDDNPATREKFGLADKLSSVPTEIVNFNLGPDHALGSWDLNNQLFKPQAFVVHSYGYFSGFAPGQKLQYGIRVNQTTWATSKVVTEVPEAMGYVTQARSHAGGYYQNLGNGIVPVNMGSGGFEFGVEHSAQWVYSLQKTFPFWKEVLNRFDMDVSNQ